MMLVRSYPTSGRYSGPGSVTGAVKGTDLGSLLDKHGEHLAIVADNRCLTFRELTDTSRRVASGLSQLGLRRGDALAVWLPTVPEWLTLLLAAARLGLLVVPLNTRYRAVEVRNVLRTTGARGVAIPSDFLGIDFAGILAEACADLAERPLVLEVGATDADASLLAAPAWNAELSADPSDLLCAFSTSGTTGNPKLAAHDQASVIRHSREVARSFDLRPGDALLCALPLSGVFGFNAALGALQAGACCVLQPVFDAAQAADLIARHHVTHVFGSDPMLDGILEHADRLGSSWRRGGVANFAGLAAQVVERAERQLGTRLSGLYGSSECFALMAAWSPDDPVPVRAQAGGVPLSPDIEVRAVDPASGTLLPHEQSGELQVRGYNVLQAYLNNPRATAEAFTADGWFRTGDLGFTRRDGGFVFSSRLKDALRLRGYLVDPAEIEEYLAEHPSVDAAQVVGVERSGEGEVAVAFVRLRPGCTTSEADLVAHCAQSLAGYKVPRRIAFVDEFPTVDGPNGVKIQKARLRELADQLVR
jgi:acyl-CoA synthetase (AMP-forming)/AMP-acid ligase II